MLLEVKDGKGEHLRNACIEALASISSSMGWKPYYALLNRCFKEVKLKPDRQKLLLRPICSILNDFHFQEVESDKLSDIQSSLHENILPKIQKLLTLDTGNVNVSVSLVALKLLKLLPGNILELQLPTIIHRVSNFLKSRLESVRDEARSALAACLKELGLAYLQFILKVLKSTLKSGFELHVLGYTLNFILTKCLPGSASGELDYCLEELLSVAENDILGDVSEEKEVEKIASKMKETRKKKSFETLKLIAHSVTFKTHALKLISPVTRHLQNQLTPKLKSKLESMLHHIASGIKGNPTVDPNDVVVFVYGLIEDGVNMTKNDDVSSTKSRAGSQCSHLITVFALGILHGHIKKMKLKENKEQVLSFLDPFVGLLCSCLSSKYEDITSASLRCLSLLVKVPSPALDSHADNIKTALFVILHGSVNTSTPLAESCVRLLTDLLKSTGITLSSDQMHMLLQFPLFVDLERNPSFVALSLLKAVVNRKVVVPEMYDLAQQVAELMVTSQVEPIHKKCSRIFLQFLLDYPISQKRLQQHLDFLLANLRYEHSTGREAVLEMLHAIFIKFPQRVINEQSQTLFLQLVVCLANDSEKKIRSMTGAALKLLIGRVSLQSLDYFLEYTLSWYSAEKQGLWSAAAQALGLLVEVMKKRFAKHVDAIFAVMRRILSSTVDALKSGQTDLSSEATIPLWKEAYYSLVLYEKILVEFLDLTFERDLEDMWEIISEFLLHPHIWLRNISNRLIAFYFAKLTLACNQNDDTWIRNVFLMRPSRLFFLAVSFCSQLKSSQTDGALKGNIIFAICRLHSMLGKQVFWSTLEPKDEEILLRAFVILDSRKGRSMFASLASRLHSHCDSDNFENHRYFLISSLLKKMGKIALDMEEAQMRIVFDCFKDLSPKILDNNEAAEQLDHKDGQTYASQLLLPLYKICEGFAGKFISDNTKLCAEEARDSIKDATGHQNFVQVYHQIGKNLKAKRDKRKQGEKIMAAVNPMRNAKRKLRIAVKHKENKKRKIMKMKLFI